MGESFLGIGGNLGYRETNLRSVVHHVRQRMTVLRVSSLYETAPVGFQNQPNFFNAIIAVEWNDGPHELHSMVIDIEADLGRKRTFQNAPRTVDIDLLLCGDTVLDNRDLTVPHPRMHQRAFVMVTLAEIAPDVAHPRLGQTMRELRDALGDTSASVTRIKGPEWARLDE